MYSSKNVKKRGAEEEEQEEQEEQEQEDFSPATGPVLRRHISHALAQLRLARTHERIEIEIEIDFPVLGGRTRRTSSPKPPICICK